MPGGFLLLTTRRRGAEAPHHPNLRDRPPANPEIALKYLGARISHAKT
jgi:hypothetical protein